MSLIDFSFEFHKEYPFWMYQAPRKALCRAFNLRRASSAGQSHLSVWGCVPLVHLSLRSFLPFLWDEQSQGQLLPYAEGPWDDCPQRLGQSQGGPHCHQFGSGICVPFKDQSTSDLGTKDCWPVAMSSGVAGSWLWPCQTPGM